MNYEMIYHPRPVPTLDPDDEDGFDPPSVGVKATEGDGREYGLYDLLPESHTRQEAEEMYATLKARLDEQPEAYFLDRSRETARAIIAQRLGG